MASFAVGQTNEYTNKYLNKILIGVKDLIFLFSPKCWWNEIHQSINRSYPETVHLSFYFTACLLSHLLKLK